MNAVSRLIARPALVATWIALVAATALPGLGAQADELKLAHWMSPRHTMHAEVMEPWAQEIAKLSNGALTVKIYPGGALGKGPVAQFQRAVDGVADITFGLPGFTSSQFLRTGVIELPNVAIDGPDGTNKLWAVLDKQLAPEWSRVKVLGLWLGEPQVLLMRTKPIRTLADFKGMKIRTPSKTQADTITALGATPVPMPIDQVYNALSTGVIDGALTGASTLRSFKLGEVVKYLTVGLPLGRSPFFLVMNKKSWDGLFPEEKVLIDKTTGLGLSLKASKVYEDEYAGIIAAARKSGSPEVITFSPEETKKADAMLTATRDKLADGLEKQGVPAKEILATMGIKG